MEQRPSLPFWVFGYGSLIWNPEFPVAERVLATLPGFARRFCMSSIHHRGTEEAPGLVLALEPEHGAACHGVAFRVPDDAALRTLGALRERELISSAYLERWLPLTLTDGRDVTVCAYVIDTTHRQYVRYPLEDQAHIISKARGGRGPNDEYLFNTTEHLDELGIADPDLAWLTERVRELNGA